MRVRASGAHPARDHLAIASELGKGLVSGAMDLEAGFVAAGMHALILFSCALSGDKYFDFQRKNLILFTLVISLELLVFGFEFLVLMATQTASP